jgi:fucose permease
MPPVSQAGPAPSVAAWRNAVFGVFGICGFTIAAWASRVPDVRDILHASTQQMGLLVIGIAIGSMAGLVASSHVIAALGATRTIKWAYTISPLALSAVGVAASVAPSFGLLLLGLIVFGVGFSTVDVAMNLSGAANERAIGRSIMPLYHAAFSLGTVLGAAVGALTLLLGIPIGVHLGVTGAIGVVVTQVCVRFLHPAEVPGSEHEAGAVGGWRSRLAVWRSPRVLLIGAVVLGMALAEGSAGDWLSLAVVDGRDFTQAAGAAMYGVFVAAMTAGRAAGVTLLDRFGRVPVLRGSVMAAALGLALVIFLPSPVAAIAGVVLWGLGASLGFPVGMSAAADDPRTATANVSVVATIGYFAFLVGPPGIGFLGQQFGLLHALVVVLALTVVSGAAAGSVREPARSATGVPGEARERTGDLRLEG